MDGSQAEPQSCPSLLSLEGKHPPPSSVHSPQRQQQPFGFFPLCRRKRAGGGEKAPLGRFLLQCKDEERLHELPPRWSTPCSLDDCWSRNTKPDLFFCCSPALCSIPWSGRGQAAPWAPSPALFLPGLASSWDWEPQICIPHLLKPALVQSQAQGSGGRGIPRMLRSIWSVLCSVCPPGDVQPDLGPDLGRVATLPLPPPSLL